MPSLTVGDLSADHLGCTVALDVPFDGGTEPHVGLLLRVQHNAPTPTDVGTLDPAQTLLVVDSWSGPLDPTHPVEVAL